jgi:hypothetical protein
MSQISTVVGLVADLLRGAGGLQTKINDTAAAESLPPFDVSAEQVIARNVPAELIERSAGSKYPCVHVYCDKAVNQMREKGRVFSGQAVMAIEARVSSDRLENLDAQMNVLVDAVTSTLDQNRGDWGAGVFYGGAYEIAYGAVKHGGKNFIQTAKVTFDLEISL